MTLAPPLPAFPAPGLPAALRPVAVEWLGVGLRDLLAQAAASSERDDPDSCAPPALSRLAGVLGFLGWSGEQAVVRALAEAWASPVFGPVLRQQACASLQAHFHTLVSDPWPKAPAATALALYPLYRALRTALGWDWAPPLALWPHAVALPDGCPPLPREGVPVQPWTPETMSLCDDAVLRWMRDGDRQAATVLCDACDRCAAGAQTPALRVLWGWASAWCALLAQGRWPPGPLASRMVSRLRAQWQADAQARPVVAEGLLQELQCLCLLVVAPEEGLAQVWPPCQPTQLDAPWPGHTAPPSVWRTGAQALVQAEDAWCFWVDGEGPVTPPLALALDALSPALAAGPPVLASLAVALSGLGLHCTEGHWPPDPAWGQALARLLQGLQMLVLRPACVESTTLEDTAPLVAWVRNTLVASEAPPLDIPLPWPAAWAHALVAERDGQARQSLRTGVQEAWSALLAGVEPWVQAGAFSPVVGDVSGGPDPRAVGPVDPVPLLARLHGALPWLGHESAGPALDDLAHALHDLAQAAPEHLPLCRQRLAEAVARCEACLAGLEIPCAPDPTEGALPEVTLDGVAGPLSATAALPPPSGPAPIVEALGELPWCEVDGPDPDLFPLFAAEAETLLPRLAAALRRWLAPTPGQINLAETPAHGRREALRVLHTLKGSAWMAGALRLGERAHRLESLIGGALDAPDPAATSSLFAALDRLQVHVDGLCAQGTPDQPMPMVPEVSVVPGGVETRPTTLPSTQPLAAVRVPAAQLDRLLDSVAEVLLEQAQLAGHLGQLQAALQAERSCSSLQGLGEGGSAMAAHRQEPLAALAAHLAEAQAACDRQARQVRHWQQTLLQLRMVPFDRLAERLHAVVRQAATATDKSATLALEGTDVAVDHGVLERLAPVCEHLLRNAVAHGIEPPKARVAAGKPAEGQITLTLQSEGAEVVLVLRDDGAGVDRERVRARAQALGCALPEEAADDQWLACLFMPGFSTAEAVNGLAGRGVGLDAVRSEIQSLGGRIDVATEFGRGTCFTVRVPLTTAVTPVVLVRVGQRVLGVPAARIEQVVRPSLSVLVQAQREARLQVNGEELPLPFVRATEALGEAPGTAASSLGAYPVLLCRSGTHRLAWQVDAVLGRQALVTKPLSPPLDQVPGLVGISVRASGAPVLLYDPVVLDALPSSPSRLPGAATAEPDPSASAPLVLVVDDSPTVRAHLQRWLQAEGYRVTLAEDGAAALALLAAQPIERPAVVLSDLDMPRLDGLGLAKALQADPVLCHLPLLVLTARADEATFAQARALGAWHCLVKPFDPAELRDWLCRCARMGAAIDSPLVQGRPAHDH